MGELKGVFHEQGLGVPERLSSESSADYLRRLEALQRYLFHGSSDSLEELTPRAPVTDAGTDPWEMETAVYASPNVVGVVGMSILQRRSERQGLWKVKVNFDPSSKHENEIKITENVGLTEGFVHVVSKEGFEPNESGDQYKSRQAVKPLTVVKVLPFDFYQMGGKVIKVELEDKPAEIDI
jgi:hypothetical protein